MSPMRSEKRILTTHTGSLPRPDDLLEMVRAQESGQPVDQAAMAVRVRGVTLLDFGNPRQCNETIEAGAGSG
jgi:hypothetical protein